MAQTVGIKKFRTHFVPRPHHRLHRLHSLHVCSHRTEPSFHAGAARECSARRSRAPARNAGENLQRGAWFRHSLWATLCPTPDAAPVCPTPPRCCAAQRGAERSSAARLGAASCLWAAPEFCAFSGFPAAPTRSHATPRRAHGCCREVATVGTRAQSTARALSVGCPRSFARFPAFRLHRREATPHRAARTAAVGRWQLWGTRAQSTARARTTNTQTHKGGFALF
jgi:hypothetical protein